MAGLALPAPALGQCSALQPGTFTMAVVPALIAFPSPAPPDFDAGGIQFVDVQVEVKPNFGGPDRDWNLCLRSLGSSLGGGKALGDLQWQQAGLPGWNSVTTGDRLVFSGTSNEKISLNFRVVLDWARDGPGLYGTALTFTAYRR